MPKLCPDTGFGCVPKLHLCLSEGFGALLCRASFVRNHSGGFPFLCCALDLLGAWASPSGLGFFVGLLDCRVS